MGIRKAPDDFEIWPENWETWDVWMALQGGWNAIAGFAHREYLGFDRSQAAAVMQMMGIDLSRQRQVLNNLVEMEFAALPILNAR